MEKKLFYTTKVRKAVANAFADMTSSVLASCDNGVVYKTKKVIMDRETYYI